MSELEPTTSAVVTEAPVAEGGGPSLDDMEGIDPLFLDKVDDDDMLRVLFEHCDSVGEDPADYIRNSSEFAQLLAGRQASGLLGESVTVEESDENLHRTGEQRRAETGRVLDVDFVRSRGIDPSKVLFFRATQPQTDGPKPEFYWTTDLAEVRTGLNDELGSMADSAIVLVSDLETISSNGGLMADINDDQGLAVRQVGLAAFDQSRAMGSFARAA